MITTQIQGKVKFVQGAVLFALADTLAEYRIGGFKIGVGFANLASTDADLMGA